MLSAINYNICLNRNGYTNRRGTRQVIIELYQQGTRRVINTNIHVAAADFANGRIQPTNPDYDLLNRRIRRIQRQLMELEDEMLDRDICPTPQRLADAYLHHQTTTATITEWVEAVINSSQRRTTTKGIYHTLCHSLNEFQPQIRLGDLSHDTITRWQNWMVTERHLCKNTVSCRLKALRCLVNEAIKRDVIRADRDPFRHIHIPEITARREHLTEEELQQIEHATLPTPQLRRVRDAFLFCCYTGLRWSDFRTLRAEAVVVEGDGASSAILSLRQHKTGRPLHLPLGALFGGKPLALLRRYKTIEHLTRIGDNRTANNHLKEMAAAAGITKHLHWHMARHTCATLLNQHGLRMQEIQFILGHSRQEITERHYAETLLSQVSTSLHNAFI